MPSHGRRAMGVNGGAFGIPSDGQIAKDKENTSLFDDTEPEIFQWNNSSFDQEFVPGDGIFLFETQLLREARTNDLGSVAGTHSENGLEGGDPDENDLKAAKRYGPRTRGGGLSSRGRTEGRSAGGRGTGRRGAQGRRAGRNAGGRDAGGRGDRGRGSGRRGVIVKRKTQAKGGKNTNKSATVKRGKKYEEVPGSSSSFGEDDVYVDAKPSYPDDESYMEEDSEQESEN